MATVRHIEFVVHVLGITHRERKCFVDFYGITHDMSLVVFITVQNLIQSGSVVLIISKFNICGLTGKCLFMPLSGQFFVHDALNGQGTPKGTSLCGMTLFNV